MAYSVKLFSHGKNIKINLKKSINSSFNLGKLLTYWQVCMMNVGLITYER